MDTRRARREHKGDSVTLARFILLLACLLTPLAARAQVDLLDQINRQAGMANEIDLQVLSVGLNNAARPGEWAGIRIRLTDRSGTQRDVLVRVILTDVDGDSANPDTVVTTNPNVDPSVWTYTRLPFDIAQTGGFIVQVFEAVEADEPSRGTGFIPGKLLGQTAYRWGQNVTPTSGLIAVVGGVPGGISGYSQNSRDYPDANPLGHEVSAVLQLTRPDDLPDRWMGLAMVREVIWNGPSPSELRIEQVRALREWIERGGHLVIALPAAGQDWLALSNRELASLLPRVEVNRIESEPLLPLRPLLTDSSYDDLGLPDVAVTLHTLQPLADAAPGEADPILVDSQGRCVVATRSVGIGAVTVIGLPLWHRALTANSLPEADVFWHRVLGRRGQVATQTEFNDLSTGGELIRSRSARIFDQDIGAVISKSGRSIAGVMLGLIVFIAYWLVAGPGGFALLKQRGQARHAWVAFLATALAFTALAWGGATIIRPKRVEVSHLTFLDQVYGQRVQRVRSWASVLIPAYGDATVWLESDDAASVGGSRFVQAVSPWESASMGVRGSFPDSRDYSINSRAPDRMTFPARATVKQVQLDWAGGIEWESIRPRVPDGTEPLRAIRKPPSGLTTEPGTLPPRLIGELIHNLPGPLENVQVIYFSGQQPFSGNFLQSQAAFDAKRRLFAVANSWDVVGPWEPGNLLDLAAVTSQRDSDLESKLENLVNGGRFGSADLPSPSSRTDRFEWLAFFNLLPPPTKQRGLTTQAPVARRQATHCLDLSRWATRPCLIIIGTLTIDGADSMPEPVGVATNGAVRKPLVSGTTVVRWVYPLPADPPNVPIPNPPDSAGPRPSDG